MEISILFVAGIFFVGLTSLVIISLSLGFAWVSSRFKAIEKAVEKVQEELSGDIAEIKKLLSSRS